MLVFDTPYYHRTLGGWVGIPQKTSDFSFLMRQYRKSYWDAWGSWPYQTLPSLEQLQSLQNFPDFSPLSFTAVIRPDTEKSKINTELASIRKHFTADLHVLKVHLGHSPLRQPSRENYSKRTQRRLAHAAETFFVQRERLNSEHFVMSRWQDRLKKLRSINNLSSPNSQHFKQLIEVFGDRPEEAVCIALRWRGTEKLSGIFLFFSDSSDQSMHGHSFLVEKGALADFGSYLLFDQAISILGDRDIWFGGTPSGANGAGVFRFKQRFANCSSHAHIISVDLNRRNLKKIRSAYGVYSWLPNYREPVEF